MAASDICAQKAKKAWGVDRAGLARKTGGRRMPEIYPKGQSKVGVKKRKRFFR